MANKSIYYDPQRVLSYGRITNFMIGQRGVGKTYSMKKWAIRDFIKTGKQFAWIRRYENEIKTFRDFFVDIQKEFPNHDLKYDGKKFYCNGELMGYVFVLSQDSIYIKGTPWDNINKIIYDEFLISNTQKGIRYLPDEPRFFNEIIESVERMRDVPVFFLANSFSVNNVYFHYYNLKPQAGKIVTRGDVLIETIVKEDYASAKAQTRRSKQLNEIDPEYMEFLIATEYLNDNDSFIAKKTKKATHEFYIQYGGRNYGIWVDFNTFKVYASYRYDPHCPIRFTLMINEHRPEFMFLDKSNRYIKWIKEAFRSGNLFFENQTIKGQLYDVLNILSV